MHRHNKHLSTGHKYLKCPNYTYKADTEIYNGIDAIHNKCIKTRGTQSKQFYVKKGVDVPKN